MRCRSITLRKTRGKLGTQFLGAALNTDGTLVFEGQDLGDGVEHCFGAGIREYEWTWTLDAANVELLKRLLDGGDDVLAAVKSRFSDDAASRLQDYLDKKGIAYTTWSRMGD